MEYQRSIHLILQSSVGSKGTSTSGGVLQGRIQDILGSGVNCEERAHFHPLYNILLP